MPKVGEIELRRWRSIPASEVLSRLATHAKRDTTFIPSKDKHTERWHALVAGRHYELLVNGPKFYDPRAKQGGGGAVDFVMYLFQLDFRSATRFLQGHAL